MLTSFGGAQKTSHEPVLMLIFMITFQISPEKHIVASYKNHFDKASPMTARICICHDYSALDKME